MAGEAEERGIMSVRQPVTPETEGHICGICHCPDHRACGCEARAREKDPKQPALKAELPSTNIAADLVNKAVEDSPDPIQADKVLQVLFDGREAQLTALRNIVETLKAISETLKVLIPQKKTSFPESLN